MLKRRMEAAMKKHTMPLLGGTRGELRVPAADVLLETATRPAASLLPQDETSGVSAFLGTWPGDESDEELLGAILR
jgi:hypothetical protein